MGYHKSISIILYTFFTHDMPEPLPNTEYISFADDIISFALPPVLINRKMQPKIRNMQSNRLITAKINGKQKQFQIVPISKKKPLISTTTSCNIQTRENSRSDFQKHGHHSKNKNTL